MLQQGCNRPPIHERMNRGKLWRRGAGVKIRKESKTIDIGKKMSMIEKDQDDNQQHENDRRQGLKRNVDQQHKTIIKRRWESAIKRMIKKK
jgi:hypothetical protein